MERQLSWPLHHQHLTCLIKNKTKKYRSTSSLYLVNIKLDLKTFRRQHLKLLNIKTNLQNAAKIIVGQTQKLDRIILLSFSASSTTQLSKQVWLGPGCHLVKYYFYFSHHCNLLQSFQQLSMRKEVTRINLTSNDNIAGNGRS